MSASSGLSADFLAFPFLQRGEGDVGGRVVAPSGGDCVFKSALGSFCEKNTGAAFAAPGSSNGAEGGGVSLDEFLLLRGRELDHAELFIGVGKCGKDFSGNSEVGVVQVAALPGLRESESGAAEIGGGGWHERSIKAERLKITRADQRVVLAQAHRKGTEPQRTESLETRKREKGCIDGEAGLAYDAARKMG